MRHEPALVLTTVEIGRVVFGSVQISILGGVFFSFSHSGAVGHSWKAIGHLKAGNWWTDGKRQYIERVTRDEI